MNSTNPSYLSAYRHLRAVVGEAVLMLTANEPNWDGPGSTVYTKRINGARDCWRLLVREAPAYGQATAEDVLSFQSVSDVCAAIEEELEYCDSVEIESDYTARKSDERRRKLEGEASRLAAGYNVAPGSLEFIAACELELARFRNYRHGMREDGLCIGYGVSHEQWSDEFNASGSDSEAVYEILDWLAAECPLLWAKYQESKLAEAAWNASN